MSDNIKRNYENFFKKCLLLKNQKFWKINKQSCMKIALKPGGEAPSKSQAEGERDRRAPWRLYEPSGDEGVETRKQSKM